jgi:hypothetical protein
MWENRQSAIPAIIAKAERIATVIPVIYHPPFHIFQRALPMERLLSE